MDTRYLHYLTESGEAPGYWMYEVSGILRPVIERYLRGERLDTGEIATMRAYLRQWIFARGFRGPEIDALRARIDCLTTQEAIRVWIADADDACADPL